MDPQVITCDNTDLIMLYATISTLYHPANGNAVHFFTSVKSDEKVLPRLVSVAALILATQY